MGDFNIKPIRTQETRNSVYQNILRDLEAFKIMLHENMIESRGDRIGAEQEICLVGPTGSPSPSALKILSDLDLKEYTNELALFNLEVNLEPMILSGGCFSSMENELKSLINLGQQSARKHGCNLFLTGILPSINYRHLQFNYMTPEPRYQELSQELLKLRGASFEIYLQGIDDLNSTLDSVLFEACNTSFQMHLQIPPVDFARMFNWAQMISGPVLAACTNSPYIFGKELWSESRIALFKQSLDIRNQKNYSRTILPRVYFGNDWIQKSAVEIWENELFRFPLIFSKEVKDDPIDQLSKGVMPSLSSVRLHNGTTYTWNRLCYGNFNNIAHIRIECRYLPAGPTIVDEVANFVFWAGLMCGIPDDMDTFWKKVNFRVAKNNFIKAARYGIDTVLDWFGKSYSSKELILDTLLPMAKSGLTKMQVQEKDINYYLSIIEARAHSGQTGSKWAVKRTDQLREGGTNKSLVSKQIILESLAYQKANIPVHQWELPISKIQNNVPILNGALVEDIMVDDIVSLRVNVPVSVARTAMKTSGFHHIPVENLKGELVGIVSSKLFENLEDDSILLQDCMIENVLTVTATTSIKEAIQLMYRTQINCLPVREGSMLIGLITSTDINQWEKRSKNSDS